ncbi:S-layer homology domain-containing protein [Chengkuizengella sediminis]|uniref:S-layer homology domain-containing protein n=1 Tax=Chengkuizengella sediminis TaxID=1885917 RepID=UPI00138982C0|nr:Ig-like domain-containing protein [Chengkuizengella sediminis]NDI34775.1 S-layer homology domain-containing protein [Chengkuizengella sediminis]
MRITSSHDLMSHDSKLNNQTKKQHPGGDIKVMKKSLSLLVAIAMVFSMFASVASAEEMTTEQKFDELKEIGIFDGYLDGLPHLEDNMTREQAAKIIALVFGLDIDKSAESTFSDVTSDRWSTEYIEASVKVGIIEGMGDGTFAPKANVTIEEFAKMLAVGYANLTSVELDEEATVDNENISEWAQHYIAAALDLGLIAEYEDYTIDADRTFLVDSAYTTYANVVEFNSVLNVVSVTADNLREMTIEYNIALDEETAEDTSNYDLSDSADVSKAVLQEDGKTVVLTVGDVENQTTYTLEIDGVMSASGKTLVDYSTDIKVFDADLPVVEGIEFTGPKSFVVTFNEPVESAAKGNVTVKEGSRSLAVKNAVIDTNNEREVNVELHSTLDDATDYEITISNVKDFAGYVNVSYKEVFTYEENTTAPTATIVDADQQVIEVKFDKPVSGLTVDHFFHTYTSWEAAGIFTDSALTEDATGEKVTTVFVQFDEDHALPSGDVEFTILGKHGDDEITDNWGNVFEETTYVLNVVADREAPTVTDVEVVSGTEIKVTFSEAIANLEDGTYTLLDEDGEELDVNITVNPATDKESVSLTVVDSLEGETVTLEISDLVDNTLYENEMEKYSQELTFDDSTFSGINRVELVDNNLLYVIYNEEVTDSAIDADNYRYQNDGGEIKKFKGEFDFFYNEKTVRIELHEDDNVEIGSNVLVSKIEDVNGNSLDEFQASKAVTGQQGANATEVKAISKSEITVQFDQDLTEVAHEDFILGETGTFDGVEVDYNEEGTLITLTLDEASQLTVTNPSTTLSLKETGSTVNAFGKYPEVFSENIQDGIAPELVEDAVTVDDKNTIVIQFTEDMDTNELYKGFFEVNGETPSQVSINGELITLIVAEDLVEGEELEITIKENKLADISDNFFAGDDLTVDAIDLLDNNPQ